jgi:HSP20 family molecular chaperone IbpA
MGIIRNMAKEMIKEVNTKSREFYEFVLPPVDMHLEDDFLTVIIDLPGFEKKDIKITIHKNILSINAEKHEQQREGVICRQRPSVIDKKILLPVHAKDEDVSSAKLIQGVLTVKIPVAQKGKQISID